MRVLITLALVMSTPSIYAANIWYSGTRNFDLTAQNPGTIFSTTANLRFQFPDSWDDLRLGAWYGTSPGNEYVKVWADNQFGLGVSLAFDPVTGLIENYDFGEQITGSYDEERHYFVNYDEPDQPLVGEFINTSGYVGFRFVDEGETFYGWIQVEVSGIDITGATGPTINLIDWAHSTVPGQRLAAGTIVPVPAAVWLFGPAVLALIRRKSTH